MRSNRPGRAFARRGPWLLGAALWTLLAAGGAARGQGETPRPRLAVLAFTAHRADTPGELASALTRELAARLAEDERVALIDAGLDRQPPEPGPGETRDAALRRLAAELGADWLITGRATQLVRGGSVDLSVRLVPREPDLAAETQVLTARSEEVLFERLGEVVGPILSRVVGAPAARVIELEIRGAPGFEGQIRQRLETRAGALFDAGTLRSDLARLRESPAIVSAEARTERSDDGVRVRLDVVLADPSEAASGGERIAEVRVRGNRRIDAGAITGRIASKVGEGLDPARVATDIAEIHGLGFFRDVRVLAERTPAGVVLIYDVEETPLVRQISIAGNDNIDSDDIREVLTLTTNSSLDYPLLFENRQRIRALYRAQGYYLADVGYEIETLSGGAVGIHFDVNEGEKLKLRAIEFRGNQHFDDDELQGALDTKTWRFWSYATSWLDKSGTYSEPLFLQDLRAIERRYSDAGYLQARVGDPEVVPDEDGLTVVVEIEEGRRFRVGEIRVSGDSTVDIDALREKLKLDEGEIFNRSYLNDDIAALTEHYQDRGFYFAQVTPLSNLSEATETVDLDFEVRKGPLYFIRRIDVSGNSITLDSVVRREVPIVEGELYSQRKVMLGRARVERLGYFEEVDFQVEPTDEPDQLDLAVKVVERPTGSFSFGAGFSSQDGAVITGSLSQSNLFGRGYATNLSVDYGRRSQRFFLNLVDPYFLGSTYSLSTTASSTLLNFADFEQEQVGIDVIAGHALTEDARTRGFLRYGFNVRSLSDDRDVNAAGAIQREILQDRISSSLLGLSIISDTRNDFLAPTAGRQLGLSLEGSGLGGFSRFARVEVSGVWFLGAPDWLLDRSSFVVAGRAGWAVPFNSIDDFDTFRSGAGDDAFLAANDQARRLEDVDDDLTLPLTERYFLGGLGRFQLRGFRARSVGPRRAILVRRDRDPAGVSNVVVPVNVADDGSCTNTQDGCNDIDDRDIDDFDDLDATDVVGGNKFITTTFEYRFPISETVGLQGVAFIDAGNAFDERTYNLVDVTEWRYGTGVGVQWFSPFGPLALVLGFPLDRLSEVEDSPVFEFSIGGSAF